MMTLYLTFEALHKGTLTWDTKLTMSENANGKEPYKFAIGVGKQVTVREAVQGIVVLSANDAAAVLGEKLAGSEDAFGKMMTEKAHALGMTKTVFKNATGLPDPEQVTTARDLSVLALALIRDFPQDYKLFSMRYIQFRSMKLRGHNNLMKHYDGVDGIKTGYTIASGYNLVSSVNRGSTRLIGVVMGGKTAASRDDDMAALFDRYLPKPGPGLAGAEPSALSAVPAAH
jgi:D-alanyl-D-alanine carboxypeptidase (penicillin-binding protein 5/6)